ncbi:hypothetical protein VNO78_08989 [Psophocarpus tetragonolobus]|uniref:Uncharacterized protein n=1 Tax=Psophocarpus tetragonolobus TaxID=3891 RepID=A0AAN9SVU0_PSOTE
MHAVNVIIGGSKVLKKILKKDEGSFTANEGAKVIVGFIALLEYDQVVVTIKKRERTIISIQLDYANGNVEVLDE